LNGNGGYSKKFKFVVIDLNDIPEEELEDESDASRTRHLSLPGLQEGVLRGVQGKNVANEPIEERDLQACQDLFGYNGEWFDSDGATYDCNWYGSDSYYCSSYGSSYSNYGFTANQACCACGGGSTVNTVVDLLVVYTTAALNAQGGFDAMMNLINLSVFQTNIALSNSKTGVRVRLVETDHASDIVEPAGTRVDLQMLQLLENSSAMNLQSRVGADLVGLICGTQNCVGRASNIGLLEYGEKPGMFVTNNFRSALIGDYTFAHEIGHTLVSFRIFSFVYYKLLLKTNSLFSLL
jgi:hypothetical protein